MTQDPSFERALGRLEGKLDGLIDKVKGIEDRFASQEDLGKQVTDLRQDLTFYKRVGAGVASVAGFVLSSDFLFKFFSTFFPK